MKKTLIIFCLAAIVFTSCSINSDISDKMKSPSYPQNNAAADNADESGDKTSGIDPKVYGSFVKLADSGKKPSELATYIEKEIGKVSVDQADEIILALEEVQEMYREYYNQKFYHPDYAGEILNAAVKGTGVDIIERVKDANLKVLLKEVFDGGYKLVNSEGSVYPVIDYSFIKKYRQSMSPKVAGYIDIMAAQSDKAAARDAALAISWDELAQRLLEIEKHTGTYTDFIRMNRLQNLYYRYMVMYLAGLDNTLAYDTQTKMYKDEVIGSFNDFIQNNGASKSVETVKAYLEIIEKNNNMLSEEAQKFTANLYKDNLSPEGQYSDTMNYKHASNVLTKLLPEKVEYRWIYNGFAEYGHQMSLEEIIKEDMQIKYRIKGKVDDMSDGESGESEDRFNIDLVYTIKNAAIIQTKSENIMMDSDMDYLELIKAPLIKGNQWTQIAVDKSGNDRYLDSEITEINEVGGSKVYTVEYREQDSDYYEIRMIEEGIGVVSFTKLWQSDDGSFEIGYGIYKEMSGY